MAALSTTLPWLQASTRWAAQLNPMLANPLNSMSVLENVQLVTGNNVINHKLGKLEQGWILTDIQGVAVIYRNAPFNDLTLTLHSSANVTVSIAVF